ncbi:hypothetical protein GCM10025778_34790 [Paeniglutamicibacter antarcticus]|uniref:Uncharacterized protein n=1 Tax=Paeniglutamicibacter antarcticus TaxID=494023 RepID=A0ABP9TVJ8_9MICC
MFREKRLKSLATGTAIGPGSFVQGAGIPEWGNDATLPDKCAYVHASRFLEGCPSWPG